jgi:N-acetylneuraminic acid mutarotase
MPAARGRCYGTTVGEYFFVFGGDTTFDAGTDGAVNSVYRYNRVTDVWDSPTTMPYSSKELVAAILPNGKIFIAGGRNGASSKKAYWYDPYANTWEIKNDLPKVWYDGTLGTLPDGRLLLTGGNLDESSSETVLAYIYDPTADSYTPAANSLYAVADHVAATLADGRILVVGGCSGTDTINSVKTQIFDPDTNTWSFGADCPVAHGNYPGISATPCGIAYLWGGAPYPSTGTGTKKVTAYDPSTDTWSTLAALAFFAAWGA